MVSAEEATGDTDGQLEQVVELVHIEVQLLIDPFTSLAELVLQIHYVDSVQRVDDRESEIEPVAVGLGPRLELVLAPRVLLVRIPGV